MADRTLDELEQTLLNSGVAPRHVNRLKRELSDHLEDLCDEAVQGGRDEAEARRWAARQLGDPDVLAARVLERSELRTWAYRYPRVARIYYPLAYALLLPLSPVLAGDGRPSPIARWGTALLLSATVTAAMMLAMQLSIALG